MDFVNLKMVLSKHQKSTCTMSFFLLEHMWTSFNIWETYWGQSTDYFHLLSCLFLEHSSSKCGYKAKGAFVCITSQKCRKKHFFMCTNFLQSKAKTSQLVRPTDVITILDQFNGLKMFLQATGLTSGFYMSKSGETASFLPYFRYMSLSQLLSGERQGASWSPVHYRVNTVTNNHAPPQPNICLYWVHFTVTHT